MMKTGKNKRLLASILAASMLLAMSPFALAEGTEDTTGQEPSQSTEGSGGGERAAGSVQLLPAAPVEETGAEENALTPVPAEKLIFENGVIKDIDATWLAENKDKPLSVAIPAEIKDTPVTSIGQNAFNGKKLLLSISAMQPIWRRSTIRHLCTLRWHRLTCPRPR